MKRMTAMAAGALLLATTAGVAWAQPGGMFGGPSQRWGGPEALFDRYDTDGDGQVTQAEVDAWHEETFAAADQDGDGALTLDEMTQAAADRIAERMADRVAERFEWLDIDGDGLVTAEEMPAGPQTDIVARFDRDGDGIVTSEEIPSFADRGCGRGGPGWGN